MSERLETGGSDGPVALLLDERLDPRRLLFVGRGTTAIGYYRCYAPAMALGCDWVGVSGLPPTIRFDTGQVDHATVLPKWGEYDAIVVQQPYGRGWLKFIRGLQGRGVKVLFEVDDYLHGIRKRDDHDYQGAFGKEQLREFELNMRVCDGIICSTDYIARRYQKFNSATYVCRNGIDLGRYRLTLPLRPEVFDGKRSVAIGWAGATGHKQAMKGWMPSVLWALQERSEALFVSIGQPWAQVVQRHFGAHRGLVIPFTSLDVYPAAMTSFDVAIAPTWDSGFFRGKSDLRWLEAGALGVPIVADPKVYPAIEHGVTGYHAATAGEAADLLVHLIDNEEERLEVGANAKRYVERERNILTAARQWERVFLDVLA